MGEIVSIRGLNKRYSLNKTVFSNLNLDFERGRIIGLLGPNGSGKTTLIKLMAGILKPDAGTISIDGKPIGKDSKAVVSYLPERTYFNESLKIRQVIKIFKDFYADFDEERAYHMMDVLNLDTNMTIKKLSKGNKEKVQLIMVMSRRAKLYLLDEPIAGVDPAARDYIINTIISNYDSEASVLISTHLITDIEKIIDDVVFIKEGNIICHQSADSLREQNKKSVDEVFREVFRC